MEVESIEKQSGKTELEPPALMQKCPMCPHGCLHLMYYQAQDVAMCRGKTWIVN